MAFGTYADLTANIASWLGRGDLTANIPDFIVLFEAVAARKLKVRPMETSTNLTPTNGTVALPSDYLGYRRATWTGSPLVELEYLHPSLLQQYYPVSVTDIPRHFTIEGSNFKIRPLDGTATAIEFDYFAKTAALSSALNWLYTNHPDVFLHGALTEAYLFNKDPDNAGIWKARRDQVFDEISMLNFRENSGLQVRVNGQTP